MRIANGHSRQLLIAALFVLAACTPPQTAAGPEDTVRAVYAVTQQHIGRDMTPDSAIPMTDDLKALLDRAEATAQTRNEPFLEGDLAADCQDCTSLTDLVVGPQTGAEQEPSVPGHQWVQAKFKLNGNEDRTVLWDLTQTPQGWRVDNIVSEAFNLRTEATAYLNPLPSTPSPDQAP